MRLQLLLPTRVLVDREVERIVAEDGDGHFGILPRHADLVTALVPGILAYTPSGGREVFVGVDEGALVKCGETVSVAVWDAVEGEDLVSLRATVRARYVELDEQARAAKSALARLEAGVVRRFVDFEARG